MEYKRFTEKRKGKNVIPLRNAVCGFDMPKWSIAEESDIQSFLSGDAVDRLAELEDKIEQGKMIKLPCKVGDIVYFPIVDRFDYAEIENIYITNKEIIFEWVQYDRSYELTEVWDDGYFTIDDIGKTVFLTREEAEKKLKELQG